MKLEERPEFHLDCTVSDKRNRPTYEYYNSLKDKNLSGYFNETRKNLLLNQNIVHLIFNQISGEGIIIKNKIFYKAECIVETK